MLYGQGEMSIIQVKEMSYLAHPQNTTKVFFKNQVDIWSIHSNMENVLMRIQT